MHADLIRPGELATVLPEFGFRVTPQAVGKALKRLGYTDLGRKRLVQGNDKKLPLWAVRDAATYLKMNDAKLRQMFVQQTPLQQRAEAGAPSDQELINGHRNLLKTTQPM